MPESSSPPSGSLRHGQFKACPMEVVSESSVSEGKNLFLRRPGIAAVAAGIGLGIGTIVFPDYWRLAWTTSEVVSLVLVPALAEVCSLLGRKLMARIRVRVSVFVHILMATLAGLAMASLRIVGPSVFHLARSLPPSSLYYTMLVLTACLGLVFVACCPGSNLPEEDDCEARSARISSQGVEFRSCRSSRTGLPSAADHKLQDQNWQHATPQFVDEVIGDSYDSTYYVDLGTGPFHVDGEQLLPSLPPEKPVQQPPASERQAPSGKRSSSSSEPGRDGAFHADGRRGEGRGASGGVGGASKGRSWDDTSDRWGPRAAAIGRPRHDFTFEDMCELPAVPCEASVKKPYCTHGGRVGGLPVLLHVYDVSQDSRVQGFNSIFSHRWSPVKGGFYHAGVEVAGREFSFGYTARGTGVGISVPKQHPHHHFRETYHLMRTPMCEDEIDQILHQMAVEYVGTSYHLLSRNCCSFAQDLCQRLKVGDIPLWVHRLALLGEAMIQPFEGIEEKVQGWHMSQSVAAGGLASSTAPASVQQPPAAAAKASRPTAAHTNSSSKLPNDQQPAPANTSRASTSTTASTSTSASTPSMSTTATSASSTSAPTPTPEGVGARASLDDDTNPCKVPGMPPPQRRRASTGTAGSRDQWRQARYLPKPTTHPSSPKQACMRTQC